MKTGFSEDLLLTNQTGRHLYTAYAKDIPIVDYHCHLLPREIRENRQFTDLGEMWLAHDHYKWRAMRTFGIDEKFITGDASFHDKYLAFAAIMPELIGNPLYIWCALELKRYFGIEQPLSKENAEEIYQKTAALIREKNMTPRWCMKQSNVKIVCTTDDPIDLLEHHTALNNDAGVDVKVLPAFRPDKAMYCEKEHFPAYSTDLSRVSGVKIHSFETLVQALEQRLLFFKSFGTTVSDAGIEEFCWVDFSPEEIDAIFIRAVSGGALDKNDVAKYRSAFMAAMGELYHRHGFVMQLHVGTYQGGNNRGEREVGVACGFDCTDDATFIQSVGGLLNHLNDNETLPKTVLYPLNPAQIETFAILAAGFCGGGLRGRVQLGAPWWFNDQPYGIMRQFEAAANLYPVSLSLGMLTDSRSFLSYPRHELYRRVLCSYFGELVERGEYFSGEDALKTVLENICYNNAVEYFGFDKR